MLQLHQVILTFSKTQPSWPSTTPRKCPARAASKKRFCSLREFSCRRVFNWVRVGFQLFGYILMSSNFFKNPPLQPGFTTFKMPNRYPPGHSIVMTAKKWAINRDFFSRKIPNHSNPRHEVSSWSRSSASISSSRSLGVLGVYSHLLKTFLIASNAVFLVLGVNSPSSPKPSDERIYEPAGSEPWLNEKLLDFSSVFSRILRWGEPSLERGWLVPMEKSRRVLRCSWQCSKRKTFFSYPGKRI